MLLTTQEARGGVKEIMRTHFPGLVLRQVSRPGHLKLGAAWLLTNEKHVLLLELTEQMRTEASLLLPSARWKHNNAIYVLRRSHHAVFEVPLEYARLERTLRTFLVGGLDRMLHCSVCGQEQDFVHSCTSCDAPSCISCIVRRAVPVPLTRLRTVRCSVCGSEDTVEVKPVG